MNAYSYEAQASNEQLTAAVAPIITNSRKALLLAVSGIYTGIREFEPKTRYMHITHVMETWEEALGGSRVPV